MQFDPFTPEFQENPYAAYAELREQDPVHWSAANAWVLTRYEDVRNALADERLSHWGDLRGSSGSSFHATMGRWVSLMHPASNSLLRTGVLRAMSSQLLGNGSVEIEKIVTEQLDAAEESGGMDAVLDLAEPLTLSVGAALMGVERKELAFFRRLVMQLMPHIFAVIAMPAGSRVPDPVAEFRSYIAHLVSSKRQNPDGTLAAALLESANPDDYVPFSAIFIFASTQNMMNFVGNMVLALTQHPQAWRQLQRQPALVENAVEELLRFDSPVQFVALACREDMEIRGRRIVAGQGVLASIGAANHDPRQFPAPEQLDFGRAAIPHLTFGAGGLYCVGAGLARVEGRAVCSTLTKRFQPAILEKHSLRRRSGPGVLRGLSSLPLGLKSVDSVFPEQDGTLSFSGGGPR